MSCGNPCASGLFEVWIYVLSCPWDCVPYLIVFVPNASVTTKPRASIVLLNTTRMLRQSSCTSETNHERLCSANCNTKHLQHITCRLAGAGDTSNHTQNINLDNERKRYKIKRLLDIKRMADMFSQTLETIQRIKYCPAHLSGILHTHKQKWFALASNAPRFPSKRGCTTSNPQWVP